MGRIVASEFVTLDGVMDDPGGAEGSPFGGWAFSFDRGEAGDDFKYEELMSAQALLLGRRTYEGFAAAWPQMNGDEFGQKMNAMPKYVVSRTLTDAGWNNTQVLAGDPVQEARRLRDELSEILLAGSGELLAALHEADLIDEYRLIVFPITVGGGKPLFAAATEQKRLSVIDVKPAGETILLRLRPA